MARMYVLITEEELNILKGMQYVLNRQWENWKQKIF